MRSNVTAPAHDHGPPTRPALRYHGGKWRLAPWIIEHFPPHMTYVEPYGGAASVLLRKPRSHGEVYNDLDDEVVGLFRVLRDPALSADLVRTLSFTPFSRTEFEDSYIETADPIERARRLVVRSFQGYGSDATNPMVTTGFRANGIHNHRSPSRDWQNLPAGLRRIAERFKGVVIENRDAVETMRHHDRTSTLHYVDPPYLPDTRSGKIKGGERYHAYRHEMTAEQHEALAGVLHSLQGMVVLSGYPSALYDRLFADWERIERAALADGARPRTEVLWLNPAASRRQQATLFREAHP